MQDYKSLRVAVMIRVNLVNTDAQLVTGYIPLAQTAKLKPLENMSSHYDRQTEWQRCSLGLERLVLEAVSRRFIGTSRLGLEG